MCKRILFFLGAFVMLFSGAYTYGATSDFVVRTFVGEDTNPPSIPQNLTAVPVATSQINLSWDPSVDDFELTGYHVWRDGVLLATTTATAYANTGLTASTTYSYYVTAYDHFFNESASSTIVATTTFSIPPPPPVASSTGPQYGSRLHPLDELVVSLKVEPYTNSVTISYDTSMYTRSVIRWGKTTSYELGSLAEQAFAKKHETKISGLVPNTLYRFTIVGEDNFGREGVLYTGTFVTLPAEDIFPPENVTNLTAVRDGNDVVLAWDLPRDTDFAKVRVVRSDRFYPVDEVDGWVVYEGEGEGVHDEGAVMGTYQFYTVFSYDTHGNISSGAVVRVYVGTGETPSGAVGTTTLPGDVVPEKNEIQLSFEYLQFIQEGEVLPHVRNMVEIDGSKQLTIMLPYERVPEHLKTILVVLHDSVDTTKTFQFLLRANANFTAYTSTIAPLGVSGKFPVVVSVFDFSTAQIGYTEGVLSSVLRTLPPVPEAPQTFLQYVFSSVITYIVLFILFLVILVLMGYRLVRKNKEE